MVTLMVNTNQRVSEHDEWYYDEKIKVFYELNVGQLKMEKLINKFYYC